MVVTELVQELGEAVTPGLVGPVHGPRGREDAIASLRES